MVVHFSPQRQSGPFDLFSLIQNFDLTPALRSHAERRLRFALTRADSHVQRIVVRLCDINGPRGGEDKRCQLQVLLTGLPDVVVEDTEADLYFAIDRAADRAGRSVMRKLGRKQSQHRHSRPLTWDADPSV